jgi:hypothetical protein
MTLWLAWGLVAVAGVVFLWWVFSPPQEERIPFDMETRFWTFAYSGNEQIHEMPVMGVALVNGGVSVACRWECDRDVTVTHVSYRWGERWKMLPLSAIAPLHKGDTLSVRLTLSWDPVANAVSA